MFDWLRDNWLTLALLLIIIVLLAAFLRSAGGLASARRTLLGMLPHWGNFEREYLRTLRKREHELPALITGENLRLLELIKAFALLRLELPGMAGDLDAPQAGRPEQPDIASLRNDTSWRGRLARWWRERNSCTQPPNSPGGAIWASPRLLILGGPGSGKTTLLRHIALICASEKIGRSSLAQGNRVRDVYGWPQPLFPIFIPLRRLTRHCPDWADRPLLDSFEQALGQIISPDLRRSCRPGWFNQRIARGGCLLLIDGFDELREQTARNTMAARIRDLEHLGRGNRVVVTSRPVGYEDQLAADFERRDLAPLSRAEMRSLITARYTAIHAREPNPNWQPQGRADGLAQRLGLSSSLIELSRTPLLLALIIGIDYAQESGELPEERYRVYELAVEYLLERWELQRMQAANESPGAAGAGRARLNKDEKLRLAAELAWAMFNQPADQQLSRAAARERTDAYLLIRRSEAIAVIANSLHEILAERGASRGPELLYDCREQTSYWLAELGERGGLLQGESDADSLDAPIQFAHKSIQEYLAAQAIGQMVARSGREIGEKLHRHEETLLRRWQNDDWHEVIRFYAASRAAHPVVEFLLTQNTPQASLLAGWCLYERPRNPPDQATQARVRAALRALFDAPPEVLDSRAGESLLTLLDSMGCTPTLAAHRDQIIRATTLSAAPALRRRACQLLAPAARADQAARDCLLAVFASDPDYRPRLAAGAAIAPHDPRFQGAGWLPELVEVPAGPFMMGEGEEEHRLDLPTYGIGRYPVTVAQWRVFAESGAYERREYWTSDGWSYVSGEIGEYTYEPERRRWSPFRRTPAARPRQPARWEDPGPAANNLPVVNITWHEAVAYCRWLSATTGADYHLPSEAEWEKAARGPHGLIYPWGNAWEPGRCNSEELGLGRPSPVGSFRAGASPYGVEEMLGNVGEWCATKHGKAYPYDLSEDEWDESYLEGEDARCLRGGAFWTVPEVTRGSFRLVDPPRFRYHDRGLRVASRSPRPRPES